MELSTRWTAVSWAKDRIRAFSAPTGSAQHWREKKGAGRAWQKALGPQKGEPEQDEWRSHHRIRRREVPVRRVYRTNKGRGGGGACRRRTLKLGVDVKGRIAQLWAQGPRLRPDWPFLGPCPQSVSGLNIKKKESFIGCPRFWRCAEGLASPNISGQEYPEVYPSRSRELKHSQSVSQVDG